MMKAAEIFPPASSRASFGNRVIFVAKALITLGLLAWLFQRVGIATLLEQIGHVGPFAIAISIALSIMQTVIGAVRWRAVILALQVQFPWWKSLSAFYAGVFFNCLLPSSLGGDVIRVWKAQRSGLQIEIAVNSVLLDRVATLIGLLIMILIFMMPLFRILGRPALIFLPISVLVIGGLVGIMLLDRLPIHRRPWLAARKLATLSRDSRRIYCNMIEGLKVLTLSICVSTLMSLTVYTLAAGMKLQISIVECIIVAPPIALIAALPFSLGGWGLREASFVFAFGALGVTPSAAFTLSILFGVVSTLSALPGCIFWMRSQ